MSEPLNRPGAALLRPEFLLGAANPLWGYFAGAALSGMAWWLASLWLQPGFVERCAEAAFEPAAELMAEAVGGPVGEALVRDVEPLLPVGGEAAPFGVATLEAEVIANPALEAEFEPAATPAPRGRRPREADPKPH